MYLNPFRSHPSSPQNEAIHRAILRNPLHVDEPWPNTALRSDERVFSPETIAQWWALKHCKDTAQSTQSQTVRPGDYLLDSPFKEKCLRYESKLPSVRRSLSPIVARSIRENSLQSERVADEVKLQSLNSDKPQSERRPRPQPARRESLEDLAAQYKADSQKGKSSRHYTSASGNTIRAGHTISVFISTQKRNPHRKLSNKKNPFASQSFDPVLEVSLPSRKQAKTASVWPIYSLAEMPSQASTSRIPQHATGKFSDCPYEVCVCHPVSRS